MSVEDDYSDYLSTRDDEGGLHQGRSDVPLGLNLVVAVVAGLVLVAAAALVLIG